MAPDAIQRRQLGLDGWIGANPPAQLGSGVVVEQPGLQVGEEVDRDGELVSIVRCVGHLVSVAPASDAGCWECPFASLWIRGCWVGRPRTRLTCAIFTGYW